MDWIIHPLPVLRGTLGVPGDKSISHRLALISALARGRSLLHGFLDSEDCLHALDAVAALGAGVRRHGTTVEVEGTAGALRSPADDLDMGNSGTLTRLLAGLVAGFPVTVRLFGDASLQSRPMRRILDPLRRMGADIVAEGEGERAPLRIRGGTLDGIAYDSPVASAQVKSALLLAGLRARGTTRIRRPPRATIPNGCSTRSVCRWSARGCRPRCRAAAGWHLNCPPASGIFRATPPRPPSGWSQRRPCRARNSRYGMSG